MVSRPLARLALVFVAAAAAVVPRMASAGYSTSDWVSYGPPPPGAVVQTFQGQSDGQGGCTFEFSASLSPDQNAVRADEVAFDQGNCQSQVAFTYDSNAAPPPPISSDSDVTEVGPVQGSVEGSTTLRAGPAVAAALTHSAGYQKSWLQDPLGLVDNSVQNGIDWNWDGGCVPDPFTGSAVYTSLGALGWTRPSDNLKVDATCARATSNSYAHFHSGVFCFGTATDIYYDRNWVYGMSNGFLDGTFGVTRAGGCTNLLSFHEFLQRTLS